MAIKDKDFSIVVVGQLTLDDIVPFDSAVQFDCPGGAALYAAGGAYLWRRDHIGLVTRKGCDFDLSVVQRAAADLIDMRGVIAIDTPNIHIWNMFDRKGHRYFITQRWGGKDDTMAPIPEDIPCEYYGGTKSFLIPAYPIKWQAEVIRSMPDDAVVLVDPHLDGIYPENRELWDELLKKINIFLPSEDELIRFFGIEKQEDISSYIPYLREIASEGPEVVCVKIGPRGVLAYDKRCDKCWQVPAYNSKIVDVTGCGDAFCGGFLSSYVQDSDVYRAALCGSVSSSFNIEQLGSMGNFAVNVEDVQLRYKEFEAMNPSSHCEVECHRKPLA